MEFEQLTERISEIRSKGPGRVVRERIADNAQALSRAGDMQQRLELVSEALAALCVVLYELDSDQRPANVDAKTWRILIPTPWGGAGWRRWGLRNWEQKILNSILRIRCEQRRHVALFDYSEGARTWHVNRGDFPTMASALAYLKTNPITLQEWRPHADRLAEGTRLRMQRRRTVG